MNQADLATSLGVSRRTVAEWDREGLAEAARVSEKPVDYDELAALRWAWQNKREQGSPASDAKARKLEAEASAKELELAVRREQLVSVSVLRSTVLDLAVRLRAKIIAFKGSLAPRLTGIETPREVSAVLGPAFDELIEELRSVGEDLDEEGESAA